MASTGNKLSQYVCEKQRVPCYVNVTNKLEPLRSNMLANAKERIVMWCHPGFD